MERRYLQSGARHPNEGLFYCKITNQANGGGGSGGGGSGGSSSGGGGSPSGGGGGSGANEGVAQQRSYIVPGEFLPNRLTPGTIPRPMSYVSIYRY